MRFRVAATAASVLSHVFEVGETATDSTTTVTVAVTDPSGATVASGNASHGVTGEYSFAVPAQAQVTVLDVAWSATIAGTPIVERDVVEVVGGFFFTLSDGRASDSSLTDRDRYPTWKLDAQRLQTEEECERICDRAFVPRYARVTVDGTGEPDLILTHPEQDRSVAHIRTIRSVRMAQRADQTFTPFTTPQLAALRVSDDGTLRRLDGAIWTEGFANVIVEYEYGLDAPPEELKTAAMVRFRTRLQQSNSNIPERASSFTAGDGGVYRLDMPGAWKTGLPYVDAVYGRYSRRSGAGTGTGGQAVPASRTLNYDPQRGSLFHGGRR